MAESVLELLLGHRRATLDVALPRFLYSSSFFRSGEPPSFCPPRWDADLPCIELRLDVFDSPGRRDSMGDLPGGDGELVDEQAGATQAGRPAPVRSRPGHVDHGVARDVGPDDGAAPAEEAAMHVDTAADGNVEPSAAPG
ncbi:DUF5709 domain-containing protein [Streptomyces gardneri]|uniref:DUF5709 domain-containing protein n=2 Tax=Streptomyces gardneri TaxID=66892 RepID=UPI0035D6F544